MSRQVNIIAKASYTKGAAILLNEEQKTCKYYYAHHNNGWHSDPTGVDLEFQNAVASLSNFREFLHGKHVNLHCSSNSAVKLMNSKEREFMRAFHVSSFSASYKRTGDLVEAAEHLAHANINSFKDTLFSAFKVTDFEDVNELN